MDNENSIETDNNDSAEEVVSAPVAPHSNLPLIITLVALITYFGFQTVSLLAERGNLGHVKASQEGALQEAQKIQSQFRAIVTKTGDARRQRPWRRKNGDGRLAAPRYGHGRSCEGSGEISREGRSETSKIVFADPVQLAI